MFHVTQALLPCLVCCSYSCYHKESVTAYYKISGSSSSKVLQARLLNTLVVQCLYRLHFAGEWAYFQDKSSVHTIYEIAEVNLCTCGPEY